MTRNKPTTAQDVTCTGCKHDIPGDCANRHIGDDGYLHFPEGDCKEPQNDLEPGDFDGLNNDQPRSTP